MTDSENQTDDTEQTNEETEEETSDQQQEKAELRAKMCPSCGGVGEHYPSCKGFEVEETKE